jgi:hypothetical protein
MAKTQLEHSMRWITCQAWLLPLALALVSAWPVLDNEMVFDDVLLIVNNPKVQHFDRQHLWENLTSDYFHTSLPTSIGYYRPLVKLGFMLQYRCFGLAPMPYHLVSLVWFALVILAGYGICRQLGMSRLFSVLATSFLAVHPGQAESVGIVSSQSDVMMATFFLTSLICYLRWRSGRGRRWLALALLAQLLSLLCKETAVVLIGLMVLFELTEARFALRRIHWMGLALATLPLLICAVIRLVLGVLPLASDEPWRPYLAAVLFDRLLLRSLLGVLWPPHIHMSRPSPDLVTQLGWMIPALFTLGAAAWTVVRAPRLRWGVAILVLPLLPALSPATRVPGAMDQFVASDRWVLLPALGAGLIWGGLTLLAWERVSVQRWRPLLLLPWLVVIFLSGMQAQRENASFKSENDRTIFLARALKQRGDPLTRSELVIVKEGQVIEARRARPTAASTWHLAVSTYRELLRYFPHNYSLHFQLGDALAVLGHHEEALYHVHISFHGEDPRTQEQLPRNDSLVRNRAERALWLGMLHQELGRPEYARHYYRLSLQLNPKLQKARQRLAALGAEEND